MKECKVSNRICVGDFEKFPIEFHAFFGGSFVGILHGIFYSSDHFLANCSRPSGRMLYLLVVTFRNLFSNSLRIFHFSLPLSSLLPPSHAPPQSASSETSNRRV